MHAISGLEAKSGNGENEDDHRQRFVPNCSEMSKMDVERTICDIYDFVAEVSMKPLVKANAIEARRLEI